VNEVSLGEAMFHFATIGWKVIFATIPPSHYAKGTAAFCIALAYIGLVTMFVGEVATIFGCVIGLKPSVTAITFVALGTSLPDTFASKTAAQTSEYADAAISNVTGSNCVNVFLGLGLPWVISAMYQKKNGAVFEVPAGDLAFSVMMYLSTSIACFILLIVRRFAIGGELGGPPASKYLSAFILVCLWLIYIIFSSLKAYGKLGE
jgi:solute carrier family 8 (sodium/calcium exchanger)